MGASKRRGSATLGAPRRAFGMGIASSSRIHHSGTLNVVTIAVDASLRLARHKRRAHLAQLVARRGDHGIASWSDFYAALADQPLLAALDDYPEALLISGCDWAATTAVTRLFKRNPGFAASSWGHDDELDGALL